MFNLNEILQNAQDGKAIENLAQRFGLSTEQAQAAVHALIPAISAGLLKKAAEPGALGSIIAALNDTTHRASFADPEALRSEDTVQKGKDALNQIFGSSHITHQIAEQASGV